MYILENKIVCIFVCGLPFNVCFMVRPAIFSRSVFYYILCTKINILCTICICLNSTYTHMNNTNRLDCQYIKIKKTDAIKKCKVCAYVEKEFSKHTAKKIKIIMCNEFIIYKWTSRVMRYKFTYYLTSNNYTIAV